MSFKGFLKKMRSNYRIYKYEGDKYQCPFCGFSSRDFLQIGLAHNAIQKYEIIGAGIRNGGCAKCSSIDRDRLLYAYFKNELKIFKNNEAYSILHFAPEKMLSEEFLKYRYKDYICTDKFMKGYEYPSYTINMDILDIQFPKDHFDLIICNHVLEHIEDDLTAMNQLLKVLKPNGIAVLQVPISKKLKKTYEDWNIKTDKDREKHFGQYDHVRIYGQDYREILEDVGFKVNRINISEKYKRYGVNPKEDLFICSK